MIRRPPRSTLFPSRRSSDLVTMDVTDERQVDSGVQACARELGSVDIMVSNAGIDRKSTRLNSSHLVISYAVFCLKKKKQKEKTRASTIDIDQPVIDTGPNDA